MANGVMAAGVISWRWRGQRGYVGKLRGGRATAVRVQEQEYRQAQGWRRQQWQDPVARKRRIVTRYQVLGKWNS